MFKDLRMRTRTFTGIAIYIILGLVIFSTKIFAKPSEIFDYKLPEYTYEAYEQAISVLMERFERTNPKFSGLIALRISTYCGPGLCTPKNLVLALSKYLERYGIKKSDILIVGDSENTLRECGYLPPLSQREHNGNVFEGMQVFWINDPQFHDKNWVYTNPITADRLVRRENRWKLDALPTHTNDPQSSYLPTLLMFGVDWWINLPIYVGSFAHGVIGSLMQGSILNITNNRRFLDNPANCAAAAAQISAIKELRTKHLFSIATFERFQFTDSLVYNENYTRSFPHVLLSTDQVALDTFSLKILNDVKALYNFKFLEGKPTIFQYAEQLGLGSTKFTLIKTNVRAKKERQR